MTAKLLVVALDAADGAMLDDMSRSGALPHLVRLRERGHFHRLAHTDALSDDSLWASFQYGMSEAEHGRHFYRVVASRGRRAHQQEDITQAFWHELAREGRRIAVFDIPKCASPVPLDGIHLTDWLAHGRYSQMPTSHPPELAGEVLARFGPPPPSRCGYLQQQPDDEDIREIAANLLLSVERKRAAALHYLGVEHWDLFMVGFKEAHCAGHGMWHLADTTHAEHDPAAAERLGHPVQRIYQALDEALGALAEAAGPGAEIVVFSTSDMKPNGAVKHLLPAIAERLDRRLKRQTRSLRQRLLAVRPAHRHNGKTPRWLIRPVPSNENVAAFNLIWPDGPQAEARLDAAEALLRGLVDPATGETAFVRFTRSARSQSGARAAALPDLVAHCRPNVFPAALISAELGRIEAPFQRMRPGNHLGGGAVFAAGPRVEAAAGQVMTMQDFAGFFAQVLKSREIQAAE